MLAGMSQGKLGVQHPLLLPNKAGNTLLCMDRLLG